jgi:hypothetical protein
MGLESFEPYQMTPTEQSQLCSDLEGILRNLQEPHDPAEKAIIASRLESAITRFGPQEYYPERAQQLLMQIGQLLKSKA